MAVHSQLTKKTNASSSKDASITTAAATKTMVQVITTVTSLSPAAIRSRLKVLGLHVKVPTTRV